MLKIISLKLLEYMKMSFPCQQLHLTNEHVYRESTSPPPPHLQSTNFDSQFYHLLPVTMPTQASTSPASLFSSDQCSPQFNAAVPKHVNVQTSDYIQNGCIISYVGRSGEDRYITAKLNEHIQMYAVFDGHGGKNISSHLKMFLPQALAEALINVNFNDEHSVRYALTNAYIKFDQKMFNAQMRSGSTAIVSLYSNNILYLVNLGDARAVVFDNLGKILAETHDHKPNEEQNRIKSAGGYVEFYSRTHRVNGVLAVSRAFGDFCLKHSTQGNIDQMTYNPEGPISVIPDITRIIVPNEINILLASDGLYDVFSSQDAVNFITQSHNFSSACQNIVNKARLDTTDDITVIIARL
ncbi:hypothetical protein BH23THE1_BH23THE1_33520 [soil metagenome]